MDTRVKAPTQEELEERAARGDYEVSPEEWCAMYDDAVRKWMGISAEEFIERWNAGEYDDIADKAGHRHIIGLAMLIPGDRRKR
jgi:hypothetical protein